jgi:hypothetical protein
MCAALDPDFERLQTEVKGLTEFAVLFRYPEEWSDDATASQSLSKAEVVRETVRSKLGLE